MPTKKFQKTKKNSSNQLRLLNQHALPWYVTECVESLDDLDPNSSEFSAEIARSMSSSSSYTSGGWGLPANWTKQIGGFKSKCNHDGLSTIKIGGFDIRLAGTKYLYGENLPYDEIDALYTLNGDIPNRIPFGRVIQIRACELQDYGGVPANWEQFIYQTVDRIISGERILAYCTGSHGRTGVFAASLIAVMEPEIEDPIDEIRSRHCSHAVETLDQAEAVFALKGQYLPERHLLKLHRFISMNEASNNNTTQKESSNSNVQGN